MGRTPEEAENDRLKDRKAMLGQLREHVGRTLQLIEILERELERDDE